MEPLEPPLPVRLDLAALLAEPLTETMKGLPSRAAGQTLTQLGGMGLRLLAGDLPLPVAVLKQSALEHNGRWMRDFVARAGASLCPHGKTTMAPQLFQRQFDDGAWGITAATAAHVRSYRRFGVPRIILANQLVGPANFALVFDELERDHSFDFYLLIDSVAALAALQEALAARPLARPVQVLLEVGTARGRTGVRNVEQGLALGRALRDAGPAIALRGVEAFEGVFGGDEHIRSELGVHAMLSVIADLAGAGCAEHWFAPGEVILSAGGSAFFDIVAGVLGQVGGARTMHVVLRSGCYLSHDSLHYARMQSRMRQRSAALWGDGKGLQNALEVWACVQSLPEPGRAICSLGKRDLSSDLQLPQPLWWFRPGLHCAPQVVPSALRVTSLNDQHAFIDSADGLVPWRVGDYVGFGVGHPCTTFDKWTLLLTVDDQYQVTGGIRTFF